MKEFHGEGRCFTGKVGILQRKQTFHGQVFPRQDVKCGQDVIFMPHTQVRKRMFFGSNIITANY